MASERKRASQRQNYRLLRARATRRHPQHQHRPLSHLRHPQRFRLHPPSRQPTQQQSQRARCPHRQQPRCHPKQRRIRCQPRPVPHHCAHHRAQRTVCRQPICPLFHPRPNQRRRAQRTRAHLGLRQRPRRTVFHAHSRLGQAAHARRQFCAPRLCRQKRIPLCFHRAIYVHPRLFAAGANLHAKHQIMDGQKPQPPRRSARAKPQLCVF